MSTLSMVDLNHMPSGLQYFPHVVSGGLYKTDFLLMKSGAAAPGLNLFSTNGTPMAVSLQ
jgi:hypothetical protein